MLNMCKVVGKTLNPNRDKSPNSINRISLNGTNITDVLQIAESMNDFFCSVGKKLAEKLPKSRTKFHDYLKQPQPNSFFIAPFSEVFVTETVERLNKRKSGPDVILNRILSLSIEHIKKPITYLIHLSMTTGAFPEQLKIAQVVPLFKKGDTFLCTNYRPISLLSCFHKLSMHPTIRQ